MPYLVLAYLVVALHLAFILLACAGALLAYWWPEILWLQVPSTLYGVGILWVGWVCPLTPLEKYLRRKAGGDAYSGDFIGHYIFRNDSQAGSETRADRKSALALLVFNLLVHVVLLVPRVT